MTAVAERLAAALSGRYRIERELGAGGMATVYLAFDEKHDRKVAIKVLKPELAAVLGAERFVQEIKTTAAMSHPHILPLFDSGEADGFLFYVMPWIQGETIREKLNRETQFGVDEAVRIAREVADALDYAHRHGVIHRDIKPENILLHDGRAMVMDFGIALAVSAAAGGRMTETGLSLGTPHYMSPEQATAEKEITGRSDQYSLASVLYEMLAGQPPHNGGAAQQVIMKIITEAASPVTTLRKSVPPNVSAAIGKALEKLPADRFDSTRAFSDALGSAAFTTASTTGRATGFASGAMTGRERTLAAGFALAAVVAAALGLQALRSAGADPLAPNVRFSFETPESFASSQLSVSPDGRYVAFNARNGTGAFQLWLRPLDSPDAVPLPGTEDIGYLAWSPNSRQIAFAADDYIMRAPVDGGAALPVAKVEQGEHFAWLDDSTLVVAVNGELHRLRTGGGVPTKIPTPGLEGARWRRVTPVPGLNRILAVGTTAGDSGTMVLYALPIDEGTATRIGPVQGRVSFASPDQLLYAVDGALYAQRLNPRTWALEGDPVRLAESITQNVANVSAGFGVSENGVLAYRLGGEGTLRQLRWYSRSGAPLDTVGPRMTIREVRLSPDGQWAATIASVGSGIASRSAWVMVMDLASKVTRWKTPGGRDVADLAWAANSRSLYVGDGASIRQSAIGSATDSVVYRPPGGAGKIEDVAPDGSAMLIYDPDSVRIVHLDGSGSVVALPTPFGFHESRISPDGTLIAWHSMVSTERQVFVADFPAWRNPRQVSAASGYQPLWRGDSRELYFLDAKGVVMAARRRAGSSGEFEAPAKLFQSPLAAPTPYTGQWDVTRDGQRFLFVSAIGGERPAQPIEVVHDWRRLFLRR